MTLGNRIQFLFLEQGIRGIEFHSRDLQGKAIKSADELGGSVNKIAVHVVDDGHGDMIALKSLR